MRPRNYSEGRKCSVCGKTILNVTKSGMCGLHAIRCVAEKRRYNPEQKEQAYLRRKILNRERALEAYYADVENNRIKQREKTRAWRLKHPDKARAAIERLRTYPPRARTENQKHDAVKRSKAWAVSYPERARENNRKTNRRRTAKAGNGYIRGLICLCFPMFRSAEIPEEIVAGYRKYLLLLREIRKAQKREEALNGTGN